MRVELIKANVKQKPMLANLLDDDSILENRIAADPTSGHLPYDLVTAIRDVYELAGIKVTDLARREAESSEYGACRLGIDGNSVVFRVAKKTPTKIGQFVTIWKRLTPEATITPFDISDGVAFIVVCVSDAMHRGQFVFDQKILLAKNVMSLSEKGGKRAIRVYPPWVKPTAKEAIRTQKWQLPYFFSIEQTGTADLRQVRKLFYTPGIKI